MSVAGLILHVYRRPDNTQVHAVHTVFPVMHLEPFDARKVGRRDEQTGDIVPEPGAQGPNCRFVVRDVTSTISAAGLREGAHLSQRERMRHD